MHAGRQPQGNISQVALEAVDELTKPAATTQLIEWPLRCITDAVGRLRDEVVVINALPSLGKTALVLQWMPHLASMGHVSALASLESSMHKIAMRLISNQAPMNTYNLRQGKATDQEIEQARDAARGLSDKIWVTDASMTIDQVYSWGKSQVRKGAKALFIDNTKAVIVRGADKLEKFSVIFERCTQLRKDTGVPVIILHHSTVDNNGKEKASWGQDQDRDADIQIFLRHDEERSVEPCAKHPDGLWCVALCVDKSRDGTRFVKVLLRFDKARQRFERWVDNVYETGTDFTADESIF